ncbi:MAG: hypothetical protein MZW92_58600 [Comamonadaceae bacterium]|nr:hypothetical protein [Comamonadaceae bacterium]
MVLRGLHLVLRRPVAAARRPDRRAALPASCSAKHARPACGARRAALVQSVAAGQLRRLDQVLPQRREHAQRHRELLRQGRAGGAGAGPDAARATAGHARRR